VRLLFETRYRIDLMGWVEAEEQIWLAKDVGEVQREARWKGLMLLRHFDRRWQLQLAGRESWGADEGIPPEDTINPPRQAPLESSALESWSAVAAQLGPALPAPRLLGLYAQQASEPVTDETDLVAELPSGW
jgi:hypothetical protein